MISSAPKNSTGIRMSTKASAAVAISSPSPRSTLPMLPRFDSDSEAISRPRGRFSLVGDGSSTISGRRATQHHREQSRAGVPAAGTFHREIPQSRSRVSWLMSLDQRGSLVEPYTRSMFCCTQFGVPYPSRNVHRRLDLTDARNGGETQLGAPDVSSLTISP